MQGQSPVGLTQMHQGQPFSWPWAGVCTLCRLLSVDASSGISEGCDSTAKSLRTLFPGARLGSCLRHALMWCSGRADNQGVSSGAPGPFRKAASRFGR
jgi:hypothetical protein